MVFSAFCKWGTEAQKWGVTHPKSQHPGELAVEVTVPKPPEVLKQHPWCVLTTTFRLWLPRHFKSQKYWRLFCSSIISAIPFASLFSSQPSISSLPNTDDLHI